MKKANVQDRAANMKHLSREDAPIYPPREPQSRTLANEVSRNCAPIF